MMQLADELLRRAKSGKIAWESGAMRNSYGVTLPDMALSISREGPLYTLCLLGEDRRTLDRLYSSKPFDPAFHVLQEIYDLARGRTAKPVDNSVEKAVGYLKGAPEAYIKPKPTHSESTNGHTSKPAG